MRQHKGVMWSSGLQIIRRITEARPRLLFLFVIVGLFVILTVACGIGGRSNEIVMINRLPTFTRTPLPPLSTVGDSTPTPAAQMAAAENEAALDPAPPVTGSEAEQQPIEGSTEPSGDTEMSAEPSDNPLTSTDEAVDNSANPQQNLQPVAPVVEEPTAPPVASPLPAAEVTATLAAPEVATPTPSPVANAPEASLPTATPLPTNTPEATPTPNTSTGGWSFSATRAGADPYGDGMLLFGEAVNETGSPQTLFFISGTFYDDVGQEIAGEDDTDGYTPLEVVPPGGRVPFELTVFDLQSAANYELWANSEASNQNPRQDFDVSNIEQVSEEGDYCLSGGIRNQGGQLSDYIVIVATLYDNQNNVINFGDDYYSDVEEISGDETLDFEICIETLEQNVARHQVVALGQ